MFIDTAPGAAASTVSPAQPSSAQPQVSVQLPAPVANHETVRHLLFGTPDAVKLSIKDLHRKRYADPNDWSRLLPTGRPNEVMAILTRRVKGDVPNGISPKPRPS